MPERRYSEEEVAAILERAIEAQHAPARRLPAREGMTLADLQEIGAEVGVPPELVAQAAASLERSGTAATRRLIGLPLGVGRTVELGRPVDEAAWQELVADLRTTFDARGTIHEEGAFRSWTNGNLQVLLEPTPAGHRLRMRTVKGDARAYMGIGLTMFGMAAVVFLTSLVAGPKANMAALLTMLSGFGMGFVGVGALQLPGWARRRREQMEAIAARLTRRLAEGPADPPALAP